MIRGTARTCIVNYVLEKMSNSVILLFVVILFRTIMVQLTADFSRDASNSNDDVLWESIFSNFTSGNRIRKCCPLNNYYDIRETRCRQHDHDLAKNQENVTWGIPDCGKDSVLSTAEWPVNSITSLKLTGRYCIDNTLDSLIVVLTCADPRYYCQNHSCIRKCCEIGHSYPLNKKSCHHTGEAFAPFYHDLNTLEFSNSTTTAHMGIYLGGACTAGKFPLAPDDEEDKFYLGSNGSLYVPGHNLIAPRFGMYLADDFCVELVEKNDTTIHAFLCFPEEEQDLSFLLLSLGFILSSICLLATFIVYLLSLKPQNLFGKILMCYVASLFFAYICLAIVELASRKLPDFVCIWMGYSILFSFLAAFSWLNVMSIDIWKTFRVIRSVDRSRRAGRGPQFTWYSTYAWGTACVISTLCAVLDMAPGLSPASIKPGIGDRECWFSKTTKGIYIFFITPISLIITCNICLFLATAWKCWQVKSEMNRMSNQSRSKFSDNRQQFLLYGKLFVVMGVTWSLEIVSFFVPHFMWNVSDAANALHGVFIFVIFALKKKVLQGVSHRFNDPLKRMRQLTRTGSSEALGRTISRDPERVRKSSSLSTMGRTSSSLITDYRY